MEEQESGPSAAASSTRPKGRRGPLQTSCAECRRLKLKCNIKNEKGIPCENCKKRGREHLCPDGSLTTVPRAVRAADPTSDLVKQVQQQKERIRALEDALREAHSAKTSDVHPLLQPNLLVASSEVPTSDPDEALVNSFGTLTIEESTGRTNWFGTTAASEHFLTTVEVTKGEPMPPVDAQVAPELIALGRTYAVISVDMGSATMRAELCRLKPSQDQALKLTGYYFLYGTWLVTPLLESDVYTNLLCHIYSKPDFADVGFDEVALLFAIFAVGSVFDNSMGDPIHNAHKWIQLSSGALALGRFQDVATLRVIQTLMLHAVFAQVSELSTGLSKVWATLGMAIRLAHSIGLHRDGSMWDLDEGVLQTRRRLFWELHFFECWTSFFCGRPRASTPANFDCRMPKEEKNYDITKLKFVVDCLEDVLSQVTQARTLTYPTILRLDKKLRDFVFPPQTFQEDLPIKRQFATMTRYHALVGLRESCLLYLHRPFYLRVVKDKQVDLFSSRWALSSLAVYQSSCAIIRNVRSLFERFPEIGPRSFTSALDVFSASITLASIIIRAPGLSLSHNAMQELDSACELFTSAAAQSSTRIRLALPVMERYRKMARVRYDGFHLGSWKFCDHMDADIVEEFQKLSGTVPVMEKRLTPLEGAATCAGRILNVRTGAIQLPQPQISFENVHPQLVDDFNAFNLTLADLTSNHALNQHHPTPPYSSAGSDSVQPPAATQTQQTDPVTEWLIQSLSGFEQNEPSWLDASFGPTLPGT